MSDYGEQNNLVNIDLTSNVLNKIPLSFWWTKKSDRILKKPIFSMTTTFTSWLPSTISPSPFLTPWSSSILMWSSGATKHLEVIYDRFTEDTSRILQTMCHIQERHQRSCQTFWPVWRFSDDWYCQRPDSSLLEKVHYGELVNHLFTHFWLLV